MRRLHSVLSLDAKVQDSADILKKSHRIRVANVAFDNVTMAEAVSQITDMARMTDKPRYVCTGNLDHLAMLANDLEFVHIYNQADLVLADGAPVVWLSKFASRNEGGTLQTRVTGSDLFWELAKVSATKSIRLFFLGGSPGAAVCAAEKVQERYPDAHICGTYCPPAAAFATVQEQAHIHSLLCAAAPDILLVGLGAPKQEKWIAANRKALEIPVSIGVGGSFEMAAGHVTRAPQYLQQMGLEWLFRLLQEPGRLWRRYLLRDLPFLVNLMLRTKIKQYHQLFCSGLILCLALLTTFGYFSHGKWPAAARTLYHRSQSLYHTFWLREHPDAASADPLTAAGHATGPVTIPVVIDVLADRHPISPKIYGMAFAPLHVLHDLHLGVNRWGGNDKTRYNWVQGNADNAARDWHWRNRFAAANAASSNPSSAADAFIRTDQAAQVATFLTVPTIGWIAKDADNAHASENVPLEGGQPLFNAEGPILGYDPTENRIATSVRSLARKGKPFQDPPTRTDIVYQDEWISHLVKKFGSAQHGGVHYYAMDNEPDLWDTTHTDVHPARMGYDDILANFLDYATAVKADDPTAQVTGPVTSGWTGSLYSPLDRGDDNYHTHADSNRHGGGPFLAWFLSQVHQHDLKTGKRTLDVLDVHFYPQGQGIYSGDLDSDTKARRLRATRALWDSTYVDESWIGEPLYLIPRLKAWIAASYPGTKLGITEWNFGADKDINGALAIADALGIFGREGIDLATYWANPSSGSPGYLAFKLYRNADGQGHGFDNISCRAMSANTNRISCYAAIDMAKQTFTLLLVNHMPKTVAEVPVKILGSALISPVKIWQLTADDSHRIAAVSPSTFLAGKRTLYVPPYSIMLFKAAIRGQDAQK